MKRSFFTKLILAMFISTFIPVLILSFFNDSVVRKALMAEIEEKNDILLLNVTNSIDSSVTAITNDLMLMSFNSESLQYYININPNKSMIYAGELQKDIIRLKEKYHFLGSIFLYVQDINYLLTDEGSFEQKFFFEQYQSKNLFPSLVESNKMDAMFVQNYHNTKEYFDAIMVTNKFPLTDERWNIIMGVLLRHDIILEEAKRAGLPETTVLFITDQNNKLLFCSDTSKSMEEIQEEISEHDDADQFITLASTDYIISDKQGVSGWHYFTIIPANALKSKAISLRISLFVSNIILIILCSIIAYMMARKLYSPIDNITDLFKTDASSMVDGGKTTDEFAHIYNNINQLMLENKDLQNQFLNILPVIQSNTLLSILHNEISITEAEDKLSQYQITLPHKHSYILMIMEKENAAPSFEVNTVLSGLDAVYYLMDESYRTIVLLNIQTTDLEPIKELFREYPLAISISDEVSRISILSIAYHEANERLMYRSLDSSFEWLDSNAKEKTVGSVLKLPEEYEKKYVTCLLDREFNEATKIIENVLSEYITKDTPLLYLKNTLDVLYNIFDNVYEHYQLNEKTEGIDLIETNTISSVIESILSANDKVVNTVAGLDDKSNDIYMKILCYIDNNYTKDISLQNIASDHGVSYYHLSRHFKELKGQNYVDYITKLRIEKAKILLQDPNVLIKDVALDVGYTNVNTFIRNFNKFTGVSPGQYQKNL